MTTCLVEFPVELQRYCLDFLDQKALKATRLLNRAFSSLSTEILFHTLKLLPTDESAAKFTNVLEHRRLSQRVRKVTIYTDENPELRSWKDSGEMVFEMEKVIVVSWNNAIGRILELPALREVELKFADESVASGGRWSFPTLREVAPETKAFRTGVLNSLFHTLNQDNASIDTLSIKYIQDVTEDVYDTKNFKAVRRNIQKLHLQVATEYTNLQLEQRVDMPGRHQFFNNDLNSHWLKPIREQLTHLTIFCNDYWGFYPLWEPPDLPSLRSLALGKYTFSFDWQVEWISSLGGTLQELILDDCPIVHAVHMTAFQSQKTYRDPQKLSSPKFFFTMRWYTVFPLFRTHLTKLQRFAMGYGAWPIQEAFERRHALPVRLDHSRYCIFDCRNRGSAWVKHDGIEYDCIWNDQNKLARDSSVDIQFPNCETEDVRAFEEFLMGLGREKT